MSLKGICNFKVNVSKNYEVAFVKDLGNGYIYQVTEWERGREERFRVKKM